MPSLTAVEAIFQAALEKGSPEERAAYLDRACQGDSHLRQQVERLLNAQGRLGSFLEQPAAAEGATSDVVSGQGIGARRAAGLTPAEDPGSRIGPYKLLQQIGEGGMGTVFMAEQTEPVQRKVALKVIKPGMNSRQVLARFEAERQALALMDHPNIARVLDAGTTEAGSPYFVMELVKGVPITRFCDERHLTPRQRLELFVPVCQAVQHAHQKGIIHRDLKPSNVLVCLYDGRPVPKVIDFGIAKATGQKLTERTMFTEIGQVVGTLEYMSPEQAELNQLDVDTRSDIYSLGVLLYELLTGTTPLERGRLKEAAFLEVLRLIREEEPQRPSTRLSTADGLPSIAANRGTEPKKLSGLLRGELDWIVLKSLEKDRNRRYETANGLAADVQRYLADEAVQACPPSASYRFRKFARRNKAGLGIAGMVLCFLLLLGSGAGWVVRDRVARDAEHSRERTQRLAKVAAQVELVFAEVEGLEAEQKWPEALAAARRAQAVVAGSEADPDTSDRVRRILTELEMVARLEETRLRVGELSASQTVDGAAARLYGAAFRDSGVDIETLPAGQAATRLRSRPAIAGPLAAALDDWGERSLSGGDDKAARELWSLAASIDPDPWRLRVREAVAAGDVPWLLALAGTPDTVRQPPQSLLLLVWHLRSGNEARALALLERASMAHPADFWIHSELD
jgi:serine/threonine protein kinase